MQIMKVPKNVWDYLEVWKYETGNLSISSSLYAKVRAALEIIIGETPDIIEYLDFGLYDWVTYRTNAGIGEIRIGIWI